MTTGDEMVSEAGAVEVLHLPGVGRVEARRGGERVGFLEYVLRSSAAALVHTEAADDDVAALLIDHGLHLLTSRGYRLVPLCPHVRRFLAHRPDRLSGVDTRFLDPRPPVALAV